MHETPFSYSQLESPAPNAALPPGRHRLRGWVWPKPGGHFVNVRARIAGRLFPGIHGGPRADLAEHFALGRKLALAEFTVAVELPPGNEEVTLEVQEIEGRWMPFQRVTFHVTGVRADSIPAAEPAPLRFHDFIRGLEFILRERRLRPDASWVKLAAELAAHLPVVQDLLQPPQPFIGHADEPAMANSSRFGLLSVVGYLFHTKEPITRLWATADLQVLQPLTYGRATPNLIPHFPNYPTAAASGYEGHVDVPSQLPNPVAVRLYAETTPGSLHLVQVRTTWRHDSELEKYPFPGSNVADFEEALQAWRSALRVRGCSLVADGGFEPAIEQLRRDFTRSLASTRAERPTTASARPPGRLTRAIVASHNLNLEGAPLFLLDLARQLAADGVALTVVSASDGILRSRFEDFGAKVVIVDPTPVFRADGAASAHTALADLGRAFDFTAADLVIANTFTTFWAVHAAKSAGQRVLSYVHESTSPAVFYRGAMHPEVLAMVEESLVLADAVTFTSDATRRYHAWPGRPIHAVLTPGWVDLRGIDAWLAAHPREALREKLGAKPGELLVTNVGTVCDRKGQLGFARAVDLFNRRHPELAARTRFILLGGRHAPYDDILRVVLAGLALPNLVVHPETPDFLGYYAAADVTACSSYEESSPRVVFEAMACGTPLLASAIAGISEIARDGIEATLVPPGDTPAWADALALILSGPETRRAQATRARARIESTFTAEIVLPAHTALACAVAAGQI